MPYTSIKGQVLMNLVVEFTEPLVEELKPEENMDGKLVNMISPNMALRLEKCMLMGYRIRKVLG